MWGLKRSYNAHFNWFRDVEASVPVPSAKETEHGGPTITLVRG